MTEFETVMGGDGAGFRGKAEGVEDGVHEVAGAVSSEGAAGAIGSVGTGGETKDEDACARVAESGDRTAPIGLVDEGSATGER